MADIVRALSRRNFLAAAGAGEPGTSVVAPALANAIFAATGARVRSLPFLPERLRQALAQKS